MNLGSAAVLGLYPVVGGAARESGAPGHPTSSGTAADSPADGSLAKKSQREIAEHFVVKFKAGKDAQETLKVTEDELASAEDVLRQAEGKAQEKACRKVNLKTKFVSAIREAVGMFGGLQSVADDSSVIYQGTTPPEGLF